MAIISTVAGDSVVDPNRSEAARNLAPRWVYLINRAIIAGSRTFPEVIPTIFAVKLFGFGPFTGFVALSIGTIGFYAKLLAEDIENMSQSQAEAVKATGANWFQWINYAIQPQVMPRMSDWRSIASISTSSLRWSASSAAAELVRHSTPRSTVMSSTPRPRSCWSSSVSSWCWNMSPATFASGCSDATTRYPKWTGLAPAHDQTGTGGWFGWLIALSIIFYAWHLISEKTVWFFVQDAGRQAADIGSRMFPPKFSYMEKLWRPVWDINIATLGTVIALVIAVPVAFSARNTTPHVLVRAVALFVIVSSRSVNSLIWALMLVFIFGPGVLAGTIAIGLRSIGFCAKLLYEAIEEIDHTQVEAIEATGASRAQQILFRIVPQILPTFAGVGVFRWDINIERVHHSWARWGRWYRTAAQWFDQHTCLDTGINDSSRHSGDGDHLVGIRQDPARNNLNECCSVSSAGMPERES